MARTFPLLLVLALGGSTPSPAAPQSPRESLCTEWHECRRLALAAADRREYETFHDLAWRAVQTGPPNDPDLMYLLARAQALSGRPHDALVMLTRLADMGIGSDAAANDDFRRTRQLPGWPDLEARVERLARPEPAAAAIDPELARKPAAAPPSPAAPSSPSPAAATDEAAHFSAERPTIAGLAYDAVSGRFVIGDRGGRKLLVLPEHGDHAQDLVRAESAGFNDIAAVTIDARRGDLWVASTADADGSGTLHKLQLVSGRPLKAFPIAPDTGPLRIVDLAIDRTGAVLALDAGNQRLLALRPAASTVDRVMRLDAPQPVSLAVDEDGAVAYIASADGVSRIDLRARTTARLRAPKSIPLGGFEQVRWHRGAIIALRTDTDGSPRMLRLTLNADGTAVTKARPVNAAVRRGSQVFMTVSGDDLVYLVRDRQSDDASSGGTRFTAYRVVLR